MRLIFILFLAAIVAAVFVTTKFDVGHEVAASMNKRGEAVFSSLFTFLSVFWAAVLTIWSLLKSRATRYVERLADNVVFKDFMSDLEIRLVLAFGVVIFSFAIYIVNPALAIPYDNGTIAIAIWLIGYGGAVLLLIDSLLTARLVLA
ncbi:MULTISPECIES: hypothetical protein [unclassified Mesorhizobium]|uniref:hypothetical protein n=1 Tax=unclassified Mesorhizobium TaxID=325217 RepID=UPI001129A5E9|nr:MULTISPECIES: hypothetical protein [unclassified Mesorhizobium]MBZ9703069.1 hypothetical protein [Mesorhizobium sp. CO1-1-3]MBZ9949829.1 hypothetical protein [Mesorhizobium sp. BR1-1-11]TPJ07648.1 hypothetical protein FJ428_04705 [Mesorhizobium sp. B2-8-1]